MQSLLFANIRAIPRVTVSAAILVASALAFLRVADNWLSLEEDFKVTKGALNHAVHALDSLKQEDREIIQTRRPDRLARLEHLQTKLEELQRDVRTLETNMTLAAVWEQYLVRHDVIQQLKTITCLARAFDMELLVRVVS
ncbi:hypothetical protein BKA93DRAFT_797976 [Sparassis latifolia]